MLRSLYALHPDTVLQLHERGAVVYGQPLTLSLAETEEVLQQEEFLRLVVDASLARSPDAQRALRRIAAIHPDTEISWLRAGLRGRGDLALDDLARELRGEQALEVSTRTAVVVSHGDVAAGATMALALAMHLAQQATTLLVETDTVEPTYARRLRLRPNLSQYIADGAAHSPRGWPTALSLVAAPSRPELLLELGIDPLLQRIEASHRQGHIVVRASANLGDRGLIAALAQATDVLLCAGDEAQSAQYARWLRKLAPRAHLAALAPERYPWSLGRLAASGRRIAEILEEAADGD